MAKKRKSKIIIIMTVVIVLAAGGVFGAKYFISTQGNSAEVYQVTKESFENVIEISGTVSAAQEQSLQALSDGTVTAVYVKKGESVKKGDILIQLDDTTEKYNLAKHDNDMATTKITGSANQYKLMETQRLSLLQKIADRRVIANFDGTIADLDVQVGDSLEAKDKVGTIVNVDYLTAEVEVAETDVSKLVVGQKVIFTFPTYDGGDVEGYVTGWPAIGEVTTRGATVVKVSVRIDDFPKAILPYFSFTGKIEITPTEEYLIVSRYAIGYENREPYVIKANSDEKKSVKVQPYGKDTVKIKGVKEGEILKQVTAPKISGSNPDKQNKQKDNKNDRAGPGGGGPGGLGGPGPR